MTDFVRDAITPPTGRSEAIPAELKVITTQIFGHWKNATVQW